MTKTKTKKVVSKKTLPKVENPQEGHCHMCISFNDSVIEKDTDNIAQSLMEIQPKRLYTKVKMVFSKDDMKINRFLFVPMARKVFSNRLMAELFSRGIIKALNGK